MTTSLHPILFAATAMALLAACGENKPSVGAPSYAFYLEGSVSVSDDEHAQSGFRLPRRLPRPPRARLAERIGSNANNIQLLPGGIQLYTTLGGGWQAFETKQESSS